jgi:hypothetical protein
MSSPADILAQAMIDASLGIEGETTSGWGVTVGRMQDGGNSAIATYDTVGRHQGREMRGGREVIKPGVQIKVRAVDYPTGYAKAAEIVAWLQTIYDLQVTTSGEGGGVYNLHAVHLTTNILHLGMEQDGTRELFTINTIISFNVAG